MLQADVSVIPFLMAKCALTRQAQADFAGREGSDHRFVHMMKEKSNPTLKNKRDEPLKSWPRALEVALNHLRLNGDIYF